MKNNKGITMISLVITIIVLLILSSIIIYNSKYQLKMKYLNNLYADIESINSKIADYYLKNDSLPTFENAYLDSKEDLEELLSIISNNQENLGINVNDDGEYYVINLYKLDNLTLNYGMDYKNWTGTSTNVDFQDLYIINEVTHQVYYPQGIKLGDEYYFSRNADEKEITPITFEEIDDELNVIITNLDGNNLGNDKTIAIADVTLEGNLNNYDLNSLEYAWSEIDSEVDSRDLLYTKFYINELSNSARLSSQGLSDTAEYYYLYIKAMNNNGDYTYKKLTKSASPITGNLPENYQQVEYIESSGTQWIDTKFVPNENTCLEIQISMNELYADGNTGNKAILGTRSGVNNNSFALIAGRIPCQFII